MTGSVTDGFTKAERRALSKAGVDILLTNAQFKQPGVQPLPLSQPPPTRRSHFSRKLEKLASKIKGVEFSTGSADPLETHLTHKRSNLDPGYVASMDENEDDNTDSYNNVRKIIFGQAIKYNITKLEQKYVNFTDIVDINDYEVLENHVSEDIAQRFGEGDLFRLVMLAMIVLNSVQIGVQTDDNLSQRANDVFILVDYVFLTIFSVEILFKWFYSFTDFWKSSWNIFDCLIVLLSYLGSVLPFLSNASVLRSIRVIRTFRTLRSINILTGLQIVVQTIIDSIPDMINIIILLLIFMFIWAVCGVTLFGEYLPEYFGDLGTCMFTLFIMITQIGWVESFDRLEAKGEFVAAALYYVSFMIIGVFILSKIIVAVVVSNLEDAYSNEKKKMKRKFRALKTTLHSTQGMKKFQRPIRNQPPGDDPVWKNQIPYEIPDFEKISKAKVENYFLILTIIEENLKEFAALKDQLQNILIELREVNSALVVGEEDEVDNNFSSGVNDGDALSRWMKAQG